jgi:hypothetical protein
MYKLKSFDQFSTESQINRSRQVEEENSTKRSTEAETYKNLLGEFKVTSIKELTEEQRIEFFTKLRGAEINEATVLIEEGTRGQIGKIDKKGNITSVYMHYDSYPENILPIITSTFKDGKNVDFILKNGDSSGLDKDVKKINFYGNFTASKGKVANISKYLRDVADGGGAEFVYLWDEANKEWLMADIYGKGYDDVYPAFESLTTSVNEAISVQYKRDAKKVLTVYKNLFTKKLTDFGAMDKVGTLGCIKYLFEEAMTDANFHREKVISKNIKGRIGSFELKVAGLGNHFLTIGATTTKRILDKHYSDLANAAGWSGIGIVEGTALYLESIKEEASGQALLNAFNMFESFAYDEGDAINEKSYDKKSLMKAMKADDGMIQLGNGQEYVIYAYGNGNDNNDDMWGDKTIFGLDQDGEEHEIKYSDIVSYNEATVVMDAMDPKSKILKKLLKKHNVKMKVLDPSGPSGWPEVEMTGSREDLQAVLASEDGWDDAGLEEYIEESVVTESHPKCSNKKGHAYKEIDKDGTVECEYCGLRNSLSESGVTEAKFVKEFDEAVLKATTQEEVLEIYPNAEFFIGKSDHFFGEFDENLFFKAYYTKGQKEFEIKSIYSEKNSNYVHLYNESVVTEAKGFKNTTDFEKFLIEIDGMGEAQIKKIMGKDYIDTPGYYQDEKDDYDDVEDFMRSNMGTSEFEKLESWWESNVAESVVTEAEVNSDEEFEEYAVTVLQKAFGEDFDEAKSKKVIDGILSKADGDYGTAVGMLTSSLGQ